MSLKEILGKVKIDGINPYKSLEEEMWSAIEYWIPTSSLSLNKAIVGNDINREGGIPHGRVVEISGPESSGKSSLLDDIFYNFQESLGGYILLCDPEHAHESDRMSERGIDSENLVLIEKKKEEGTVTLEEFFTYSEKAFFHIRKEDKETPIIVGLDSLAMINTDLQRDAIEKNGKLNMKEMLDKSAVMSSRFPSFVSNIVQNNATLIIVNQLRDKVGTIFGDTSQEPGGTTLKFLASLRMRLGKDGYIKPIEDIYDYDHEDPVGIRVKFKIIKNKVSAPFRTGTFPLMFDERGIFQNKDIWDMIVAKKMWEKEGSKLEKSGAWYSYGGERIGQGSGQVLKFLCENLDVLEDMKEEFFGKRKEVE